MNETLVAELEKLNQTYPFRVFELETLDGRRIRITKPFRKLWGAEEKKAGDIKIENGVIALLRYDELQGCHLLSAGSSPAACKLLIVKQPIQ